MTRPLKATGWACLLLSSLASPSEAQDQHYYSYHPLSVMSLGLGFSPADLSSPKIRAIDYEVQLAEEGAAVSTSFVMGVATNASQLKQALNLDVSVDAHFLVFKGGGHFNLDQSALFARNSASLVITAQSEYGRLTMKKQKLTAEAQKLIDAGKMAEFEQAYGSQFVAIERRGASVSVILTLSDLTENTRSKIVTGAEASVGFGPIGGSAKAAFQTELVRAGRDGSVQVQVVATGGEGFGGLSDLVTALSAKPDALQAIRESLGAYLKQFTSKNSVAIGYHTASMKAFGWKPEHGDFPSVDKERKLLRIVDKYREVQGKLHRIALLLDRRDTRYRLLSPEQTTRMRAAVPAYDKYLTALAQAHAACKRDTTEGAKGCDVPPDPYEGESFVPELPSMEETVVVVVGGKRFSGKEAVDILNNKKSVQGRFDLDRSGIEVTSGYLERVELIFRDLTAWSPAESLELNKKVVASGDPVLIMFGEMGLYEQINRVLKRKKAFFLSGDLVLRTFDVFGRTSEYRFARSTMISMSFAFFPPPDGRNMWAIEYFDR